MTARQRRSAIAKVKLELEASKATPAPPVGRAFGPHGINLAEFCRTAPSTSGSSLVAEVELAEEPAWGLRRDALGIHSLSRMGVR